MADTEVPPTEFQPVEIAFVKGMKSTSARKVFKTYAAMEKWLSANGDNITILAYSAL